MTVYKVTGAAPFMGHEPGEEFEADLDPAVERRAKARGSIKAVKAANKTTSKKEEDDA